MNTLRTFENAAKLPKISDDWNRGTESYTYVMLKDQASLKQLEAATASISAFLLKDMKLKGRESLLYRVQPFDKIILGEEMMFSMGNTGTMGKVGAEIAIGLVILLSACFNYTNLSIARSVNRGKEVGVRKVAGAMRGQIFQQFIIESVVLTMLSLGVGYLILRLLTEYSPLGQEMGAPDSAYDPMLFLWFFIFSLLTGIFAGLIPSYSLSAFKPVEVLKNLSNIKLFGGAGLRKTLIVLQFSLSIIILMFTQVFQQQFDYLAESDPGFRRDNIINVQLNGENYGRLSRELLSVKGVEKISAASVNPGKHTGGRSLVRQKPDSDPFLIDHYDVDPNFIDVLDLKLLAGDGFRTLNTNNGEEEKYVVINEKCLAWFKLGSASEALGNQIIVDSLNLTITGVVKDFYANGFDMYINPLLLRNRPDKFQVLNVRTTNMPDSSIIADLAAVWKASASGEFSSNIFRQELYIAKNPSGTVSTLGFLALISITIASLGLLGMVIYHTQTKRKEIGIRKVMGAEVSGIIFLMAKSFLKLVVIAGLIAIPVGYVTGFLFLNIFANRINIGIDIILLSFLSVLGLSAIITGAQIYRSAAANPVNSLRTE
ncbi:MAG: FtsX-like permease family protein [Gemmatimonadaceae bacterium]|nr:FtsX-like permease family protein [Chitinophagaceae bacterium]